MGRPTVVVATAKFQELARQSGEQNGLADARIVAVAHPVGGTRAEELDQRADAALEEIVALFLGRSGTK
jgi:hypothetical protein